ncbi:hypothetical protein KO495_09405 [Colwellia sp. D2M02]|uniref:hypothetical protein n=1 Tax=Colwellia sp. D2M02 TaxID=2841562 RepID=UPI001C08C583|nr:hypothetical protein [Colwellia sp. D2M02]MBU2893533.1 hypothetical protein [Colwellia sp. D2M02]
MGFEKNKRSKAKERFAGIPHAVMNHIDYIELSGNAIKLLLEAARQYNGRNNGKLCFVWSQMVERGWKSKTTLSSAKKELLAKNLLVISKYGGLLHGKGIPQYYALTWQAIDEINGFEIDVEPTIKPIRNFRL